MTLDKFLNLPKQKTNFIYNQKDKVAYFSLNPEGDFVCEKVGLKLFILNSSSSLLHFETSPYSIPVLKSNLQKAIRRCQTQTAINSALAIIQKDPIEFLRRLPIIYIEDVCLMDSYPIPVWLMMAEKEHKLDFIDVDILLHIVKSLCECNIYYNDSLEYKKPFDLTHKILQDFDHRDHLLSILYRSQYGGMKGDMEMLKNSIYYYSDRPSEIQKTEYDCIDYVNFDTNLEIIHEAIDFHPLPQMINMLVKLTNLDNNDIKMTIWYSESGLNIRKPLTIENSREYSNKEIWKKIKPKLARVRCNLMQ